MENLPDIKECCNKFSAYIYIIFNTLKFLVDFLCFIFIILIISIGKKDIFENQIIGKEAEYFVCNPRYSLSSMKFSFIEFISFKLDDSGSEILNKNETKSDDNYTYPINLPECNNSFDINNKTRFCVDMYIMFQFHYNDTFSSIFDLRFDDIRRYSIGMLTILTTYLVYYLLIIIPEFSEILNKFCYKNQSKFLQKLYGYSHKKYLSSLKVIVSFLWIGKSLIYFFLWRCFETSDIGKYEDFLKCKFVKKNYFVEYFPNTDKLRIFYKSLLILNLITEFIDKLETAIKTPLEIENNITSNSPIEINKTEGNTSFNSDAK